MPSSSTGCALIAGTEVSIRGVCVVTAVEVLWGKVVERVTGDMGVSVGGDITVGSVIATTRVCLKRCAKDVSEIFEEHVTSQAAVT